jgi:hypothetical protein
LNNRREAEEIPKNVAEASLGVVFDALMTLEVRVVEVLKARNQQATIDKLQNALQSFKAVESKKKENEELFKTLYND